MFPGTLILPVATIKARGGNPKAISDLVEKNLNFTRRLVLGLFCRKQVFISVKAGFISDYTDFISGITNFYCKPAPYLK